MVRYIFKEGPTPFLDKKKADPQKIGEAIAKVKEQQGGVFSPRSALPIIAKASDRKITVLRQYLNWNDKECGVEWRVHQLRKIASYLLELDPVESNKPEPAFIHIKPVPASDNSPAHPGGYHSPADILNAEELQVEVMRAAAKELASFIKRYATLTELIGELSPIYDRLLAQLEAMTRKYSRNNKAA